MIVLGVSDIAGVVTIAAASLDEQLRGVASFASLTLAVLAFFTTRRTERFSKDASGGLGALDLRGMGQVGLDLLLALTTLSACVAMFSLFTASLSVSEWADRDHVAQTMFSIVYMGFVAVFLFQLALVAGRVLPGVRSWFRQRRAKAAGD